MNKDLYMTTQEFADLLEVIEEYQEFRGKLVRIFAKCLGFKFDHIIFIDVINEGDK
jgi:hypothetical protein